MNGCELKAKDATFGLLRQEADQRNVHGTKTVVGRHRDLDVRLSYDDTIKRLQEIGYLVRSVSP